MNRENVEFEALVGDGLLSGVWTTTEVLTDSWNENEHAAVMYFMYNGVIYRAQEDPNDGYRSSLRSLQVCKNLFPANVWPQSERVRVEYVKSIFHPYADDIENGWTTTCDILRFWSQADKLVLEIGTDNNEDYYPSCVMSFLPQHMAINAGKTSAYDGELDLLGRHLTN